MGQVGHLEGERGEVVELWWDGWCVISGIVNLEAEIVWSRKGPSLPSPTAAVVLSLHSHCNVVSYETDTQT